MRVLHVNDIAFVGSTLVRALRDRGVEADLVEPAKPGARLAYPWKLATFPLRAWSVLMTVAAIRRARPDIVHIHYATQALPGLLGGRPWIVHCHGSDVRGVTPRSPAGRVLAPLLGRASLVLYSTPDLAEWVEPFRTDARFLPNPVDTDAFHPGGAADTDLLVATRADPVKGAAQIIETLRLVIGSRPDTTVTVVRHGSMAGQMVEAAGPGATVIDPVPHDDMPQLLRRHRLAMGQFGLGTLGQVELESCAAGVPVVTDLRLLSAYSERPPLPPAGSPAAAAASIVELLEDEVRRRAAAAALREWVVRHHAAGTVAAVLVTHYQGILDRAAAR